MKTEIYVDYAATTPLAKEVLEKMTPYLTEEYGNPGSFNAKGMRARDALDHARNTVASVLHCKPSEIIFTGSGTESINLALQGVAHALKGKGKHIITSPLEHHTVIETCSYLKKHEGYAITYVPVDQYGMVHPKDVEAAITKETVLISLMYANNEIGTVNPIKEIAAIAKKHNVLFHTDACQAGAYLNLNVQELGVDLLSLNGSKFYGPKGTGCLYKKTGVPLHPLIHGGGQEHGFRSGTENVAGIVGFAAALELAQQRKEKEITHLITLRDMLIKGILATIPSTTLNGHPTHRLPNNVNITFQSIEGQALLIVLNEHGIAASAGSACTSKTWTPSHVIKGLGKSETDAHSTIRFTLGHETTEKDISSILKILRESVQKLRRH